VMFRFGGRQFRHTLGHYPVLSLDDARRLAIQALSDVSKGINPAAAKKSRRNSGTFADVADDYERARATKKSLPYDKRIIKAELLPVLKSRKIKDITRCEIRELVEGIAERGAPVVANRTLALIKTIFNFAVDREWLSFSPCNRLKAPGREQSRERFLSDEEIEKWWKALDAEPTVKAAILRVQLLTATRISEVRLMTWDEVDLNSRWWTIPAERSKNTFAHRVALSEPVIRILNEQPRRPPTATAATEKEWVFPSTSGKNRGRPMSFTAMYTTVASVRKVVDFRTHDLRHTAATHISSAGADKELISRILNHRDDDVTSRYDHNTRDLEARAALDRWANTVMLATGGKRRVAKVFRLPRR
jgi:integrase